MDIQIVAYICFSAIPMLVCFLSTLYYLLNCIAMTSFLPRVGLWALRRPLLNSLFSAPLRFIRKGVEWLPEKLNDFVEEKEFQSMHQLFDDNIDKVKKNDLKRSAGNWEKWSIILDYFLIFSGELVLMLIMYLGMHILVPDLEEVFKATFDNVQTQISSLGTFSLVENLVAIVTNVSDFFATMIGMIDFTNLGWLAFIVVVLFTAAPIRVWSVPAETYTPEEFFPLLGNVVRHYISSFISTFFSVQAIFAIIGTAISLVSSIFPIDSEAVFSAIVRASLYFSGTYCIAFLAQMVIYTGDLIIAVVSLPFRVIWGLHKANNTLI